MNSYFRRIAAFTAAFLFSTYLLAAQCSVPCNTCELPECPYPERKIQANEKIADEDVFEEWNESNDTSIASDEFSAFEADTTAAIQTNSDNHQIIGKRLFWPLMALLFTGISGVLVRFGGWRKLRLPILLASLVFLGFYTGGCPCPISSVQDVALAAMGVETHWQNLIWFLGLIPLTYFFGKTWCGWVCHLGAMQEFLFKSNKFAFLKGAKAQMLMKEIRLLLVIALAVQLFIMRENWFCRIDPFKAAFNLSSYYAIGWVLLGLLFLSSLFIYRPFCKAACPIGLLLGFVSKIPGAAILGAKEECTGCSAGVKSCSMEAISRTGKDCHVDNKECIACGDCMESCPKGAMEFNRLRKILNK